MKPNPNHRGDPLFLLEVLRLFGVQVIEPREWNWRLWGNGDFNKIQGIFAHHTGGNNTGAKYIAFNPRLSNKLSSQIHLSRAGVATLCGAGIAWHAGQGSAPGWPTNNANPISIGIEADSDGVSPWPPAQLDAYHRICAAILWYLGKRADKSTLLGHHEYSGAAQGKWDPGAGNGRSGAVMDMNAFRARVNHYIDNPPHLNKPAPAPESTTPKEIPMTPEQVAQMNRIENLLNLILDQLVGPERDGEGFRTNTGWPHAGSRTLHDSVTAVGEFLGVDGMRDLHAK